MLFSFVVNQRAEDQELQDQGADHDSLEDNESLIGYGQIGFNEAQV
jgi:hypothetical protein